MCRETCVYSAAVLGVLIKSGLSDLSLYLRDCSPFSGSVRNTTVLISYYHWSKFKNHSFLLGNITFEAEAAVFLGLPRG